ncbi:tetratricopeptide repeat-containing diguanylate cyclase [Aliikangiella sp. IMCC44359]|uniref:tetratricopeptide repeat-containing diguanylate cyclase n=1 Tax=Aliikangiella sp. IMCC44359 TaxID=3459125 RepID=UPI00403A88A9
MAVVNHDDVEQLHKELTQMNELVLTEPVYISSRLQEMDEQIITSEKNLHLLWLLRYAEATNYSYNFEAFNSTVDQALKLIDNQSPVYIAGKFLTFNGVIKQRAGDYGESIKVLKQAVELTAPGTELPVYVVALVELAYTQSLAEQFEAALFDLQLAYKLADSVNSQFLLGLVNETQGVLYAYMGKYDDSIKSYQKAHQQYLSLKYPYYIGESAFGIASTYRYQSKTDKAIEWFNKYKQAVSGLNKTYTNFFYHYGVAMTYTEQGDCSKALPIIQKALNVSEFNDYKAELFKRKAVCDALDANFIEAETSLVAAKNIYLNMPTLIGTSWELETEKVEAKIAALKGDYESAYLLINEYYEKYSKAQETNTSSRLENLRLTMMRERERLELMKLENQSQIQQLKLNEQLQKIKIQKLWLYLTLIFILLILGFVWWQYKVSRKLKALAITDELTGLSNRRLIFTTIERLLKRKNSKSVHHSLMLIDVDDLKPINDQYGHQDGDKVLKMVADAGRSVLRGGDIFARIGGDEYMLFLTRTDKQLEMNIAKRIIERVRATPIITGSGVEISVSVSIGIVSIDDLNVAPETLYSRVDSALYQAKADGRNRVNRWQHL